MSAGLVAVRYTKWGGIDHWHFELEPLGQDEFGWWFFGPKGLIQQRGSEPPVIAPRDFVSAGRRAVIKVAGTTGGRMSVTPDPAHLSNHHRNTVRQIFEHPVSHNIEWRAVVSLLEAVGTTVEQPGGKLDVTIGTQKEFIEPPAGKDLDTQAVLDLRRMLSSAGYGPDVAGPG